MPDEYASVAGMKVDPEGQILFDFDGHVHAEGLDLDAHESGADPLPHSTIRWLRESDGSVVATAWATHGVADPTNRRLDLVAGTTGGRLQLDTSPMPRARVSAGFSGFRTLIDHDELSDFFQVGDGPSIRRLYGPFDTGNSGDIAAHNNVVVVHNHNLDLVDYRVIGMPEAAIARIPVWSVATRDPDAVTFVVTNPTTVVGVSSSFAYFVIELD